MKYKTGDRIAPRILSSVMGSPLALPDPEARYTHVQFRRWTGCPICNVHIAQFRKSADAIKSAGIREIIFFHSKPEEIATFQADLPFDMVGDPHKKVYKEFGVEASLKFILSFKVLLTFVRGMLSGRFNLNMRNGPHGLPADFLIAPDGRIVAVKYGQNAYDQWSAQELLALARADGPTPTEELAA